MRGNTGRFPGPPERITAWRGLWRPCWQIQSIALFFVTYLALGEPLTVFSSLHGSHATREEQSYPHSGSTAIRASDALAHTLGLLHPPRYSDRRLDAAPRQHGGHHQEGKVLPVCSQSKYLCQVHALHSPKPRSPSRIQNGQRNGSQSILENRQRAATPGSGATPRVRRLGALSARQQRKHIATRLASTAADDSWRGVKLQRAPLLVDYSPAVVPALTRMPQLSRHGGEFLPLRVQTEFADFTHPLESQISNLSIPLWQTLEKLATEEQPDDDSADSWVKQSSDSDLLNYNEGVWRHPAVQKALRFRQVRRFFQVDVVPSALWWLQRAVMVDRTLGPYLIKTEEEADDKY